MKLPLLHNKRAASQPTTPAPVNGIGFRTEKQARIGDMGEQGERTVGRPCRGSPRILLFLCVAERSEAGWEGSKATWSIKVCFWMDRRGAQRAERPVADCCSAAACRGIQLTRAMVGARKRDNRDGEVDVEGSLSSTWAWAAEGIDPLCRLAPGLMFFGVLRVSFLTFTSL
jgi:hypothetical protein